MSLVINPVWTEGKTIKGRMIKGKRDKDRIQLCFMANSPSALVLLFIIIYELMVKGAVIRIEPGHSEFISFHKDLNKTKNPKNLTLSSLRRNKSGSTHVLTVNRTHSLCTVCI